MSDIITAAVRAGCKERRSPVLDIECGWPDCPCGTTANALETAARHAAEAMREKAAFIASEANRMGVNRAAIEHLIRAIPTGDTP